MALKKITSNDDKGKNDSYFYKLYKFFYKREKSEEKNLNKINSDNDAPVSNISDEKQGLKEKKISE